MKRQWNKNQLIYSIFVSLQKKKKTVVTMAWIRVQFTGRKFEHFLQICQMSMSDVKHELDPLFKVPVECWLGRARVYGLAPYLCVLG